MVKKSQRGVMGLGMLIIFIAIILVVGVTAIVLLTSGGSLQQKGMMKSGEAKKGVSSGLEVVSIIGNDASITDSTPHVLDDLHIMVRLLPGTSGINLNNTLIYIEFRNNSQTSTFNTNCSSECEPSSWSGYNVFYLEEGAHFEAGYVNMGDVAKLTIKLRDGIGEDQDVKLHIIPAHGPQTVIRFQTPMTMVNSRITVWPTS